jgi:hypothetical protein
MVDFQEVKGSLGNSSVFMDSIGHRIFLTIEDNPGYIEIKRGFWSGFSYSLVVNDKTIPEATQEVDTRNEEIFRVSISDVTFTQDELSENQIAWYVVNTTRIKDGVTTTVHRYIHSFFLNVKLYF